MLHLVTADVAWPELEFDDIADAIAVDPHPRPDLASGRDAMGRCHRRCSRAAGRARRRRPGRAAPLGRTCLAGAFALVLLGGGVVLSRTRDDAWTGAVVASIAIPYAFIAGLLGPGHSIGAHEVLIGSGAAAIVGGVALAAVGRSGETIIAGLVATMVIAVGAGLDEIMSRADAAAVVLGAVVLVVGLIPAVAVRLGGVSRWHPDGGTAALADAVARTEAVVTGLLGAVAIVALAAGSVLAYAGDTWARILAIVGAVVLGLRARDYRSIRQRLVALVAAGALVRAGRRVGVVERIGGGRNDRRRRAGRSARDHPQYGQARLLDVGACR